VTRRTSQSAGGAEIGYGKESKEVQYQRCGRRKCPMKAKWEIRGSGAKKVLKERPCSPRRGRLPVLGRLRKKGPGLCPITCLSNGFQGKEEGQMEGF